MTIDLTPERVGAIAMLLDDDEYTQEKACGLSMEEWFELCEDSRQIVRDLLAEARRSKKCAHGETKAHRVFLSLMGGELWEDCPGPK